MRSLGVYSPNQSARNGTEAVPFFNALPLRLDDIVAKCGGRFPFWFKVFCDLVRALVSQVEIAFRDQEEMEKSPERTFQTRQFPSLSSYFAVPIAILNVNVVWSFSVCRGGRVTVI